MQVQETGTPKLCPGIVILESSLTTGEVNRGGEGKVFKECLLFYLSKTEIPQLICV